MQGNKLRIGDISFPVIGSREALPQASNGRTLRWANYYLAPTAFDSISALLYQVCLVNIAQVQTVVNVQQIFLTMNFNDSSSSATYSSLNIGTVQPVNTINNDQEAQANLNITLPALNYEPLNILMPVDNSRQISFNVYLNAGMILKELNVTPAAGDTISFVLSLSYLV